MELGKELSEAGSLSHAVSNSTILCLGTGAGDHRLALRRQDTRLLPRKDSVAGGGAPSVRTPGPVGVSVDDELGGERLVEQTVVGSAVEIAEEALESTEVGLSGFMHMETNLLNCIGDVRPGEGAVLKCTGQTLVCSRVCHWVALGL